MREFSIVVSALVVFLGGLITTQHLGMQAVAQEDAPASAEHPLVGAWLIDLGEEGGRLVTFSATGIALFTDVDGTGQGSWAATGDMTASFTIWQLVTEQFEEGASFTGYFLITGEIQVKDDESWTGDLTLAQTNREGTVQGMDGPFTLTATRLPMIQAGQLAAGEPVLGSLSSATPAP
jgi:hypothetical protein